MAATVSSTLYKVGDITDPRTITAMRHRICSDGLALFDGAHDTQAMLTLAKQVMSITPHPNSDELGVTTIVELGPAAEHPNAGGFSRRELMAHTDRSGIPEPPALMMLTCAIQARSGGASRFCDGLAVRDDLAANSPEVLETLSCPRSALFGGAAGYLGAVFASVPGPGPVRTAIRLRLDDLVSFSLDVAECIPQLTASISHHSITVTLRPGQGVILDNHRWLHARDTFEGPRRMYRLLGNPLADLEMYSGIPAEPALPISVANSQR
jgi:alpha-ketoglutarate-dependent taurine dioxygenase